MSDNFENQKPKKISADHVEVIDAQGQVIQEAKDSESSNPSSPFGGGFKVMKGGPAMLLLLPILLPIMFVGIFILLVFALLFGRKAFRVIKFK